ncbi:YqaE/Pmp3 family membrane protein [Citrobacter koseri]|uniref:YqaE/Pmp3 family membrane protein n=1 Tax=Citrobacter koseri TaxID=545 RepID=UPI001F48D0FB|nr:YqaE/Pmp3 family membrane protein [Citrobacter koseri]
MRLILAIFFPFISFFTIGKPFQGLFCLLLQITLIGWIPAALWAVYALNGWKMDQKLEQYKQQHSQPD